MNTTVPAPTEVTPALAPPATLTPIKIPMTGWIAALIATAILYLCFNENGVVLAQSWEYMHELFHDGRHVFGVPCH